MSEDEPCPRCGRTTYTDHRRLVGVVVPKMAVALCSKCGYNGYGTCKVCGCSDTMACEGGCSWTNRKHDLCSNCVDAWKEMKDRNKMRPKGAKKYQRFTPLKLFQCVDCGVACTEKEMKTHKCKKKKATKRRVGL
jgi:hypothetical protein